MDVQQIDIPRSEVSRYLGYYKVVPDAHVQQRIEVCICQLRKACQPRWIDRVFPVRFGADHLIVIEDMRIHSANLRKNLDGCEKAVLMAVTIGQGVDLLIRRAEVTSMTDAAIYQAAGAAYVEAVCDQLNQEIAEKAAAQGYYCRPRFSPGYGDFALEHQKDFFRILDITRNIGVNLSDSLLMSPSKSVTALIGLSRKDLSCSPAGCESCSRQDTCEFRRDDS